jgi:hypothetical protein
MSTQRGNAQKTKAPKHKNKTVFKNDLHDTSHTIKKINELEFFGVCNRCKSIIDWKVKYKKYKPLTTKKKCVKCLEKKITDAYYIVCKDCCVTHKICSKCSKPSEELVFGETESERRKKDDQLQSELKMLSERQRRKFLRLVEKGAFTKESLIDNPSIVNKQTDSSSIDSDEEDDDELNTDEETREKKETKDDDEEDYFSDEEENTEECDSDDDHDDYETDEEEDKELDSKVEKLELKESLRVTFSDQK